MREPETEAEKFISALYWMRSLGRIVPFVKLGRPELDEMLNRAVMELDLDPSLTEQYALKGLVQMLPACPPYYISNVTKPPIQVLQQGCLHKTGQPGVFVVVFYKTQDSVPLNAGQVVRYAAGQGYYAYPPTALISGN